MNSQRRPVVQSSHGVSGGWWWVESGCTSLNRRESLLFGVFISSLHIAPLNRDKIKLEQLSLSWLSAHWFNSNRDTITCTSNCINPFLQLRTVEKEIRTRAYLNQPFLIVYLSSLRHLRQEQHLNMFDFRFLFSSKVDKWLPRQKNAIPYRDNGVCAFFEWFYGRAFFAQDQVFVVTLSPRY